MNVDASATSNIGDDGRKHYHVIENEAFWEAVLKLARITSIKNGVHKCGNMLMRITIADRPDLYNAVQVNVYCVCNAGRVPLEQELANRKKVKALIAKQVD